MFDPETVKRLEGIRDYLSRQLLEAKSAKPVPHPVRPSPIARDIFNRTSHGGLDIVLIYDLALDPLREKLREAWKSYVSKDRQALIGECLQLLGEPTNA